MDFSVFGIKLFKFLLFDIIFSGYVCYFLKFKLKMLDV